MTDDSQRGCIRGCTVKGEHYAACLDALGIPTEGCKGCMPREARDGALICRRCYGRSLGALYDVPDLVGAIRARAYPIRAQVFDKVMVSGTLGDSLVPDPVAPDLIEASDELTRTVQAWADHVSPPASDYRRGLRPGSEADEAHGEVLDASTAIVDAFPKLANDSEQVVELCRFLLDTIDGAWTVAAAMRRWPLVERAWWAAQPCPYCALRTIKVTPPRRVLDDRIYECAGCGWMRTDSDTDGPWPLAFSRRSGEKVLP